MTGGRPASDGMARRWGLLFLAMVATGSAGLFVHDFAMTRLNIPYPEQAPPPGWATYLNILVRICGTFILCRLGRNWLRAMAPWRAAALIGALLVMTNETLRLILLEVTTTREGWLHGYILLELAQQFPRPTMWFLSGLAVAFWARRSGNMAWLAAGALIVTALALYAVKPPLDALSAALSAQLQDFDAPQAYAPPFPAKIYVVIYATYLEPSIAAFVMAAMVWPQLNGGKWRKALVFTLLVLAIKGRLIQFFVASFWVKQPPLIGFLAEGQFFMETAVQALLTGLAWYHLAGLFDAGEQAVGRPEGSMMGNLQAGADQ